MSYSEEDLQTNPTPVPNLSVSEQQVVQNNNGADTADVADGVASTNPFNDQTDAPPTSSVPSSSPGDADLINETNQSNFTGVDENTANEIAPLPDPSSTGGTSIFGASDGLQGADPTFNYLSQINTPLLKGAAAGAISGDEGLLRLFARGGQDALHTFGLPLAIAADLTNPAHYDSVGDSDTLTKGLTVTQQYLNDADTNLKKDQDFLNTIASGLPNTMTAKGTVLAANLMATPWFAAEWEAADSMVGAGSNIIKSALSKYVDSTVPLSAAEEKFSTISGFALRQGVTGSIVSIPDIMTNDMDGKSFLSMDTLQTLGNNFLYGMAFGVGAKMFGEFRSVKTMGDNPTDSMTAPLKQMYNGNMADASPVVFAKMREAQKDFYAQPEAVAGAKSAGTDPVSFMNGELSKGQGELQDDLDAAQAKVEQARSEANDLVNQPEVKLPYQNLADSAEQALNVSDVAPEDRNDAENMFLDNINKTPLFDQATAILKKDPLLRSPDDRNFMSDMQDPLKEKPLLEEAKQNIEDPAREEALKGELDSATARNTLLEKQKGPATEIAGKLIKSADKNLNDFLEKEKPKAQAHIQDLSDKGLDNTASTRVRALASREKNLRDTLKSFKNSVPDKLIKVARGGKFQKAVEDAQGALDRFQNLSAEKLDPINKRLNEIDFMEKNPNIENPLSDKLSEVDDLSRNVQEAQRKIASHNAIMQWANKDFEPTTQEEMSNWGQQQYTDDADFSMPKDDGQYADAEKVNNPFQTKAQEGSLDRDIKKLVEDGHLSEEDLEDVRDADEEAKLDTTADNKKGITDLFGKIAACGADILGKIGIK